MKDANTKYKIILVVEDLLFIYGSYYYNERGITKRK